MKLNMVRRRVSRVGLPATLWHRRGRFVCALTVFMLFPGATATLSAAASEPESPEPPEARLRVSPDSGTPVSVPVFRGEDCGDMTITQSADPDLIGNGSAWCGDLDTSSETSLARAFVAPDDIMLNCVTFGVRSNAGGEWPVEVRVLAGGIDADYNSMNVLTEAVVQVADGTEFTFLTAHLPARSLAQGQEFVVELRVPSRAIADGGDGGLMQLGFNAAGQDAPSYIRAPSCGLENFADLAGQGFPNRHLVMVLGITPAPEPEEDFGGFAHTPLGDAQLSMDQNGLLISNIGSSGQDGVSIALGEAQGLALDLAWPVPPTTGAFQTRYLDASGAEMATLEATFAGGQEAFVPNFAGSPTYEITLLHAGEVVGIYDDLVDPVLQLPNGGGFNSQPRVRFKCVVGVKKNCIVKCPKWNIDMGDPVDVLLLDPTLPPDTVVIADSFWVTPTEGTCGSTEPVATMEVLGTDLGSLSIAAESLEFFNGMYMTAAEGTEFAPLGGALTLRRRPGAPSFGLSMAPGSGDGLWITVPTDFVAEWLPLATDVSDGSSIVMSATGRMAGVDGVEFGTLTVTHHTEVDGYRAEIMADYSAVGSATQRMLIYDGETLVGTVVGNDAVVEVSCATRGDWIDVHKDCGKGLAIVDGQQTACYFPRWPQRVRFTFDSGLSFEGDGLAVLAESPSGPIEGIESFDISMTGYDEMVMHNMAFTIRCPSDINEDGLLDFFDLQAFLNFFSTQDPRGDFNNDGIFDFFDLLTFLNDFTAGCP